MADQMILAHIRKLIDANNGQLNEDNMTDGLPASKATEILSAPGVGELKTASNAAPRATPPGNDPKAKSSSNKLNTGNEKTLPSMPNAGKTQSGGMMETSETDENAEELAEASDKEDKDDGKKKKFPFNPFKKGKKDEDDDGEEDNDSDDESDDSDDKDDKKGKKKFPFFMKKGKKDMKEEIQQSDHFNALFTGEENLSEDFKTKAATIFETAMAAKEEEICEAAGELFEEALEENVSLLRDEITEHLDSYLNYVVEQWMEDNRLEVENGLKNEITESFMAGLRNLFAEHYVEVPEGKVDILESMNTRIAELEARLSDEIDTNIQMSEALENYRKLELVSEQANGLSDTQFEKFVNLCETVSYESDEDFSGKIAVIKESYFNGSKAKETKPAANTNKAATKVLTEETGDETDGTTETNSDAIPADIAMLASLVKGSGQKA